MSNTEMDPSGQALNVAALLSALQSGESGAEANIDRVERELIDLVCKDHEQAFELLFERHRVAVKALAGRYVDNQDTEDVVMEVFVKARRGMSRFERRSALATWLYKITVRHCLNARKRKPPLASGLPSDPDSCLKKWLDTEDPAPLPRDLVLHKEHWQGFLNVLNKLPENWHIAFLLNAVVEVTESQAAELMKCSISQFRGYYNRARDALRKCVMSQI